MVLYLEKRGRTSFLSNGGGFLEGLSVSIILTLPRLLNSVAEYAQRYLAQSRELRRIAIAI